MPLTRLKYHRALSIANRLYEDLNYLRKITAIKCHAAIHLAEKHKEPFPTSPIDEILRATLEANINDAEDLAFIRTELQTQKLTAASTIRHRRWVAKKTLQKIQIQRRSLQP